MTQTLAEMFIANSGGPIEMDGKLIIMSQRFEVVTGQEVRIEFIESSSIFRQGIELSLDRRKGLLEINGENLHAPVLWVDTAPGTVVVRCYPNKSQGQLNVWNVWQYSSADERIDSWTGNAGMNVVKLDEKSYEIICSSGIGEVNFSDLRFKLTL